MDIIEDKKEKSVTEIIKDNREPIILCAVMTFVSTMIYKIILKKN